jgi:hypothetical protein
MRDLRVSGPTPDLARLCVNWSAVIRTLVAIEA